LNALRANPNDLRGAKGHHRPKQVAAVAQDAKAGYLVIARAGRDAVVVNGRRARPVRPYGTRRILARGGQVLSGDGVLGRPLESGLLHGNRRRQPWEAAVGRRSLYHDEERPSRSVDGPGPREECDLLEELLGDLLAEVAACAAPSMEGRPVGRVLEDGFDDVLVGLMSNATVE
jgi:hypothetical protein